jgi:hypothetical protein
MTPRHEVPVHAYLFTTPVKTSFGVARYAVPSKTLQITKT